MKLSMTLLCPMNLYCVISACVANAPEIFRHVNELENDVCDDLFFSPSISKIFAYYFYTWVSLRIKNLQIKRLKIEMRRKRVVQDNEQNTMKIGGIRGAGAPRDPERPLFILNEALNSVVRRRAGTRLQFSTRTRLLSIILIFY